MVTYPSYDNNQLSGSVNQEYWNKLRDDLSTPLYNRSTQTRIAPGSTFKPVSAVTGLETGVLSSPSETITTKGVYDTIASKPKCWYYPYNHGTINVNQAICVSCNYFFYEVGHRLSATKDNDGNEIYSDSAGVEQLRKFGEQFGLTSTSGVEITESDPHFSTEDSVRSAIGQGSHSFTNTQLARYVTTLANQGNDYKLTLMSKVENSKGKVIYKKEPDLVNKISIKQTTWDAVKDGMIRVTSSADGTVADVFSDLDYKVAGKTGTAQQNKSRYDHALFIGYAPADNPKYAMSCMIPYGDSSSYPAEVAHDVLQYLDGKLSLKKILKSKANTPTSDKVSD